MSAQPIPDVRENPDVGKDVTITLRLEPVEHRVWLKAAAAEDRSLSNWVRRACNQAALGMIPKDERERPRKPKRRSR